MLTKEEFNTFTKRLEPLVTRQARLQSARYGIPDQAGDVANELWLKLRSWAGSDGLSGKACEAFATQEEAKRSGGGELQGWAKNAARRLSGRRRSMQAIAFENIKEPCAPADAQARLMSVVDELSIVLNGYRDLSELDRHVLTREVGRKLGMTTGSKNGRGERQALMRARGKIMKNHKQDMLRRFASGLAVAIGLVALQGRSISSSHQHRVFDRHQLAAGHQLFETHQSTQVHQVYGAHQSGVASLGQRPAFETHQSEARRRVLDLEQPVAHQHGAGWMRTHQRFQVHQLGTTHQLLDLHQMGEAHQQLAPHQGGLV